MAPSHLSDKI